ncbi:L-aspartate oxidase [Candidatus Peregrinibacteria bacterium]|nr:L-aspartate oxidase [Candidatus Peregrinibacteria bacterium]
MQTNFLVIGSGISGLNFALHAAKKSKIIIATKKNLIDANTNFAQGGIAGVLDRTDSPAKLIADTLKAGAYHNNKKAVEFLAKNSTQAIHSLIKLGVEFEKEKGQLKLTRTGREIEKILVKKVKENPNITIMENTFAVDLLVRNNKSVMVSSSNHRSCNGAVFLHENKILNIFADRTILATGGIGQLFQYTTNPEIATGDGLAMGIRAGCKVKDMEFIQFHPTALAKKTAPLFLLSETLRGEGAKIVDGNGKRFVDELASRDKVAQAIYKKLATCPVYLDIRHKPESFLKKRFPKIYKELKKHGLNLAKDLIPVTPAAHYICGGIVTDLHCRTNIKNLFAFGEVACTGVHGANRLASNSLLEALVFSNSADTNVSTSFKHKTSLTPKNRVVMVSLSNHDTTINRTRQQIQHLLWQYAGIVRNLEKIKKEGIPKLQKILKTLNQIPYTNQQISEAKNMALVGLHILKSAVKRKKSLGCHQIEP